MQTDLDFAAAANSHDENLRRAANRRARTHEDPVGRDEDSPSKNTRGWRPWRYFKHARQVDQQSLRRPRRRVLGADVGPARVDGGPSGASTPWR
jgi:hypothetical protein